jgi:hypothetical protein
MVNNPTSTAILTMMDTNLLSKSLNPQWSLSKKKVKEIMIQMPDNMN